MATFNEYITKNSRDDGPDYTPEMRARMHKRNRDKAHMVPPEHGSVEGKTFAQHTKPKG